MTKNQARLLRFFLKFPYGWHTIGPDSRRTVHGLVFLGLVEWNNETKQARLALNESARADLDKAAAEWRDANGVQQ